MKWSLFLAIFLICIEFTDQSLIRWLSTRESSSKYYSVITIESKQGLFSPKAFNEYFNLIEKIKLGPFNKRFLSALDYCVLGSKYFDKEVDCIFDKQGQDISWNIIDRWHERVDKIPFLENYFFNASAKETYLYFRLKNKDEESTLLKYLANIRVDNILLKINSQIMPLGEYVSDEKSLFGPRTFFKLDDLSLKLSEYLPRANVLSVLDLFKHHWANYNYLEHYKGRYPQSKHDWGILENKLFQNSKLRSTIDFFVEPEHGKINIPIFINTHDYDKELVKNLMAFKVDGYKFQAHSKIIQKEWRYKLAIFKILLICCLIFLILRQVQTGRLKIGIR